MFLSIRYILPLLGCFVFSTAAAQTGDCRGGACISLQQYLQQVARHNLEYAAEKYNVSMAEAAVESAKVFPDPELSVGGYDNQQSTLRLGRGWNSGFSTTIELGGKRKARIALAKSEAETARALLQDFYRNLRADAAIAWFQGMLQYRLLQVQQDSWQAMQQLAGTDSIRFKAGVITETDARQSAVEARSLQNDLYQSEADWKTALISMNRMAGNTGDSLLLPAMQDSALLRTFSLPDLIAEARQNRSDAVAARNSKTEAERSLQLVYASRKIDLGINAGLLFSGEAANDIAPTPAYRSVNAGIAIPLKFSNRYRGDINAAKYAIGQAGTREELVKQRIAAEVSTAYQQYISAVRQVQQFRGGLLTDARKIMDSKIYSYQRGETPLLDVLNARRTYNELQQRYYQALYGCAAALVELERSAGIWDL